MSTLVIGIVTTLVMGATCLISMPLMIDHVFKNVNNNVSQQLHIWKKITTNFGMWLKSILGWLKISILCWIINSTFDYWNFIFNYEILILNLDYQKKLGFFVRLLKCFKNALF
jgi:uncharacterized membrane-anchored protein